MKVPVSLIAAVLAGIGAAVAAADPAYTGTWRHTVQDLGTAVLELNADGTFVFAEEDHSEEVPGTYTIENGIATFNARSTVVYRVNLQGDYLMFARLGTEQQHSDDVVLGTWHRQSDAPLVPAALSGQGKYSVHAGMLTLVDDQGGVSQFMVEKRADGVLLKPLRPGAIPDEPEAEPAPVPGPSSTNLMDSVEAQQSRLYEQIVRAEMRNQLYVELDGERYRLDDAYRKVLDMEPASSTGRAAKRRLAKLELSYGEEPEVPEAPEKVD
jgi:hypothetical protein